jgi:hypothetical protein
LQDGDQFWLVPTLYQRRLAFGKCIRNAIVIGIFLPNFERLLLFHLLVSGNGGAEQRFRKGRIQL